MAKDIKVMAQSRDATGTAAVRRMRRSGVLPGIVYGLEGRPQAVQLDVHTFQLMLRHHASDNVVLDLQVDEAAPKKVLLKEVQRDTRSGMPIHADFFEISMTEKMRVHVPIAIVGDAVGVQAGGVIDQVLRDLDIECLPGDLLEEIEVDVSALNIGDALSVADIKLPDGWVLHTPGDVGVVTVLLPRVEVEVKPEEAAEGAPAEPEVIGAKKEEKEEEPKE